ncbi:MAG: YciI family protein [Deltaproteobacteria bacterium]|nr:YciI family protein [Deltaproteobacteria bacterium]
MQYLLLIYGNEGAWEDMKDHERDGHFQDYMKFTSDIKASKHFLGGDALQGVKTATTVRVRDGKTQTTDGPFAETREQLGGYYLIEAKDLDEAVKIAARIPDAKIGNGCIEIRPVMSFNG